jgi:hypothetical protein
MNLVTDLGAEIAFAVLVEKRYNEKIEAKDILPLIGRLNEALNQIAEKEDSSGLILSDGKLVQTAAH